MGNIVVAKMFGDQLNLGHWSVDGLVFYWRGIPAGNVVDESLNRNHGTIDTALVWQGNGLFNNKNGAIDFDFNMPTINGTFILVVDILSFFNYNSLWDIGISASDPYGQVSNSFESWVYNTGVLAGKVNWTDTKCEYQLPAVGVYTIAFTWETGGNSKLYVDGILRDTQSNGGTTAAGFHIGGGNDANSYGHAIYHNALIYNRVLPTWQIAELNLNPNLPMQQPAIWLFSPPPVVGVTPKGPLGHPFHGPFGGPVAA